MTDDKSDAAKASGAEVELSDFVRSTLVDIVRGVQAASEEVRKISPSAVINPTVQHAAHSDAKDVTFDIAVTAIRTTGGGGRVGIKVWGFQAGGRLEGKDEDRAENRIKFAVPVALPSNAVDQYPSSGPRRRLTMDDD